MPENVAGLKRALKNAASELLTLKDKRSLVVYNNDADGIAAGAICKAALERAGFAARMLCVEKLLPEITRGVHSKKEGLVAYADLGSGHVREICVADKARNLVVILDHHDTVASPCSNVLNLNPELFGMDGETYASGSTMAYLFAKALNEKNVDLAKAALLGVEEIPSPRGPLIQEVREDGGEVRGVSSQAKNLTILGSTGYYSGGPEAAVEACLQGFDEKTKKLIKELDAKRKAANKKLLEQLRKRQFNKSLNIQWFYAGEAFKGMGVKTIGSFCSYLSFQHIVNPRKYLVGFMPMEREIPGFGRLERELTKVSMRAPRFLAALVQEGKAMPCVDLLVKSCEALKGSADGHSVAASGVVPKGREKDLIEEMEKILSKEESK